MYKAKVDEGKSKLPILNDETIKQRIERQMESLKLIKQKKASAYQKKIFLSKLDRLFDILICQCEMAPCEADNCSVELCSGAHVSCLCLREEKIPIMELGFIHDQRSKLGHAGKMQMGRPDLPETIRQQ